MVSKFVSLLALVVTVPVTLSMAYDVHFQSPNHQTQWNKAGESHEIRWTAVPGTAASLFRSKGNFSLLVGLGQEGGTWLRSLNVQAYVSEKRVLIPTTELTGLFPGLYKVVFSLDQDHYSQGFYIG